MPHTAAVHRTRLRATLGASALAALTTTTALAISAPPAAAATRVCDTHKPCSTRMTISAPATRTTTQPAFHLTGTLHTSAGSVVRRNPVRVYQHTTGHRWVVLANTKTTTTGTWSVAARPKATTTYKAVSIRNRTLRSSTSRTVTVRVAAHTNPAPPVKHPAYVAPHVSAAKMTSCTYAVKPDPSEAGVQDMTVNLAYTYTLSGGSWWRLLPAFGTPVVEKHENGEPYVQHLSFAINGDGLEYDGPTTAIPGPDDAMVTLVWAPGETNPAKYKSIPGPTLPDIPVSSCTQVTAS